MPQTLLGGGYYQLRTSALPPPCHNVMQLTGVHTESLVKGEKSFIRLNFWINTNIKSK